MILYFRLWMIHSLLSPLLIWVFGCCSALWPLQKRVPPVIQLNWVMYWGEAGPPHSPGEPDQSSCCTCAGCPPLASTQTCFYMCLNTRREQHKHTDTGAHVHVSAVSTLYKNSANLFYLKNITFHLDFEAMSGLLMLHPNHHLVSVLS